MSLFEQLGKKISDAGQGASQRAKDFTEITRLNGMISDKEKQISQIYAEIGRSYYERHKNDEQSEETENIAQIKRLNTEIVQHREKIKQIKGITKCPNCGADVPANAAFCNSCGTKVAQPTQQQTTDGANSVQVCPACGKPIPDGNKFCSYCGEKL